jgi:cytochrome c oxidase cbb3-type subunit 4
MELYSLLRQFADSWALLFLTLVFLGVILWAWRPGSRAVHDDVANSIFRNEKKPAVDGGQMPLGQRPAKEA